MPVLQHGDPGAGAHVHDRIRHDIIFGQRPAGARLRLAELKAAYGASVSTLREALSRLSAEGFVISEGQRGFSVAPMSPANLREVADMRILLESHALRLSIAVGDTEWEARIVAAHHKLHRMEERMARGDLSGRETWKQYDWEFHQALIGACGSQELLSLHGTIFDKYLRYQMSVLTYRGGIAAAEHRQLLDHALNREAGPAAEVLRAHIEGGVTHSLAEAAG